ncbi:MAG: PAS domain S-box protein [Candidatus Omnitrophica bacterium]|nr:PAS domain S-box protein [Candidatus Omnitrophota bacterium]
MNIKDMNYQEFVDQLQTGVLRYKLGVKKRIVYANQMICEMLGCTSKELLSLNLNGIFSDKRRYRSFCKKIESEGYVEGFETRLKTQDRPAFVGQLTAKVVFSQAKSNGFVDVVVADISERKRFEKELTESKELFQTVFYNTAAAITVTDKNECVIAWNPYAEQLLGFSGKELFNKPIKELYPEKEWRRLRNFRIRQRGMLANIDTKVYKSDDSLLDVTVSITVMKDSDGEIKGSIGIIQDMTRQREAERRTKESENKIRVIFENSAVGIAMVDPDERMVSWNKYLVELLGREEKDLYLKPVETLYTPEEWKKIKVEDIRKKGARHNFETKLIHKSGKSIDVNLSVNIIRDQENQPLGAVCIIQDITQQKRVKEMLIQSKIAAEEANRSKSLFLANMSHELRTPMNTIMGMITLTLDGNLTDEQQDNLITAKEAADNLLGLLNDILDLSRVEAGKLTLESTEFHLPNVVRSVCKGLSVIAEKKNLKLEAVIDDNVPELLEGDPIRLRQVLINLINNAIKFTLKGSVRVVVENVSRRQNHVILRVSVVDQGIGIPKDKQEQIFNVFVQADYSTTRRFGGTGLGLAISKRLVEMMGGQIWVESVENKGSKFRFTCSFKIIKEKGAAADFHRKVDDMDSPEAVEILKDLRILLAEDNLVNQRMAQKMLEKKGCIVTCVENGQEAVNKVNEESFDLILMDAYMPILDGLEATKVIRQHEERTGKHIVVIALTARAMAEDRRKCLESGMDGYVSKPIDRRKLFEEIINLHKKG